MEEQGSHVLYKGEAWKLHGIKQEKANNNKKKHTKIVSQLDTEGVEPNCSCVSGGVQKT